MNAFDLTILAPDRDFFHGKCESLIVPTSDGEFGILAGHSNSIGAIIPGLIRFRVPGESAFREAVCSEGMVKAEGGEVLILAGTLEKPDEIDSNRAKRAEEEAAEELLQKKGREEYLMARMAYARAANRLKVSRIHGR